MPGFDYDSGVFKGCCGWVAFRGKPKEPATGLDQGAYPTTSVIQGIISLVWQFCLSEAVVVSQKWIPFPTAKSKAAAGLGDPKAHRAAGSSSGTPAHTCG